MGQYLSDDRIIAMVRPIGDGWQSGTFTLRTGDTAYLPGSTKWVLSGPGEITYQVHPSGWQFSASPTMRKVLAPSA